jgi:hypothetical protein
MANYRYTYESGGYRYVIEAPDGATPADLQAIVDGAGRAAALPPPAAKPKPKPKKKEDESFLSDVGARFKGGIGSLVSELGLTFKQAANLTKSVPVIGEIDRQVDALLGDYLRKSGEGIKTRAEAELSEASLENQARQQREIAQSDPGMGSKIYSGIGRYLAAPPSTSTKIFSPIDYAINAFARNLLPQTPKEAATQIATVQTAVDTPRSLAETTASMLPATLATVIPGKLVQSGARAILPRLGAEVSEAALNKVVRRGVVGSGATINAASAGSQAYEDVLAKGGTQEEADRAFQIAFSGAAATSAVAAKIPGLEQRVFAGQPVREGILRSAGRAAIGEAPQEFVEEAGSKLATNIAKLGTAAEVPIGEDVMSSGALGAIGGATIAAPIGGLQGVFSGRDTGPTAPTSGAAQAPRTPPPPPPPPPPPADMEALAKALGPVGGKVILQEPTGPQEYTFQGFDEDGGVVLADADGVVFSEDPDQIQAAIKAGVAEPESGLGGMAFGMDITEGLDDVFAPPPPPPPPPTAPTEKPKFTIETAEEEAAREAKAAIKSGAVAPPVFSPDVAPPIFSPPAGKPKFTIEMPPPSPMNAQGKSQVGKVIFDQENGVGQVPLNQNVKYRGFTAMMRPSKFLELAADLEKPKQSSLDYIRQSVEEGKGVGSPFLNLDFETGKVKSHDGRHRMMVIQEKNGDVPVPVHIFGKGEQRARSLDEGKINSFASSMTGEDGRQSTDNFSEAFLDEAAVPVSAPAPVQEPVQEPELPPPPPERVRTVTTPGGSKVKTAFEVVDAANLTAATGDLQNRDRSRSSTDLQVQDIFAKFDPERLGESLESDRGSPIVGPDNVVESGNGRVLAINKVYDESPEKADAYRKFIEDQGFDISGLDRPVLVRRRIDRMTPEERSKFVRESNMDTKLQLSTSEKAQTDAASLTPDVMSLMASPDVNASTNQGFVRAFLSKLPTQEQAAFLDKDGRLSAEGTRRLRTAVKSSAYGDADLINTLDESQDNNIKSIGGALEDAAPAWRRMLDAIKEGDVEPEMDTTKQLVEAAKIVRDVRNKGMKIGDFLSQQDAFNPLNPVTERFIRSFYNETLGRAAGREAIADVLEKYARRASEQTTSEGLFESDSMSPVEILDGILDERGSGAGQSNMFASIQPISPKRREEILDEARRVPSLSRGVTKLMKLWADGKINANEFAFEVASYSNFIEDMKNWKRWEDLGKLKVRGPDRIRSVLLEQKRKGNISEEEANFAEWFILRNENLLNDLGISVVKQPKDSSFLGEYDPLSRVMRLIKGRANDGTTVHEIMHHLERMMPQDIRAAIKRAWAKELNEVEVLSYDGKNENDTLFFQAIRAFHNQEQIKLKDKYYSPSSAFKFATGLISSGKVDGRLYQYVNPSEFWAVNATEILQGRYDVQGSLLGRLKNWLRELSIKIKGLFKLDSNAPIIKALDSLAKSDGKFVSNQMLEDKAFEYANIRDSKPVTAIAAAAALASSPASATINDTPIAPNSALYKTLESGDTKKAIELIQKSSKNPDARKMAAILALNGVGDQKTVILDPVNDYDKAIATLSKNGADEDSIYLVTIGDVRGMVLSTPKDKNIYLIKNKYQAANGVNEQTFLHEAIHAYVKARWSSVGVYNERNREPLEDRGLYNEDVAAEVQKFNNMWRKFGNVIKKEYEGGAGIPSTVISAAESPNEALAYLLTNKDIQDFAKRVVKDGSGYRLMSEKEAGKRSWWDDFVDMIRKIFGMGPARDQFFNDFLDAANSVIAAGDKAKADFRVAAVNEESVSPEKVTNNKQAVQALINGTPKQMRNAVAKAQKPNDKIIKEGADLQKENRGCD